MATRRGCPTWFFSLRIPTSGIPGSRALAPINRSSLRRARIRLGGEVLETVLRQVAGSLAAPDTPGAWWRSLRLLAFIRIPD
ncbi:hypothetical protein ACFWP7_11180 [Streptomyces sp. NPDC058470]|uniref:hypothetical protein n=1 Tax=Streptomyces sp. NPDC058470 TaxID=3346515 RepID=UPI00364A6BB4